MPIYMPSDTREALGEKAETCDSRALFMDRFAEPEAKEEPGKRWFKRLIDLEPARISRSLLVFAHGRILYGQLQSRLMVNMAGGVLENAGLCLDRFGLPYIPGSAIKGCARRMAIQELLESETVEAKAALLIDIAWVFGWGEQDWPELTSEGRFNSDFAYASGKALWRDVAKAAKDNLPDVTHCAGSVSFLPAYLIDAQDIELPLRVPLLGTLELDVLTCHHTDYYGEKRDKSGVLSMPVALDTEDPNPVVFPTVAAGHVFAFSIRPMRNRFRSPFERAYAWLRNGLSIFGIGARTNSGYGWFDCSDEIQERLKLAKERREQKENQRLEKEKEASARKAKEEAERQRREEQKAALAVLTPEQQEDYKLRQLSNDQFRSLLDDFSKRGADEQKAAVRALRALPAAEGSRRGFWDDLKQKAEKKGGKFAQTEQAIRALSKAMFMGKDGKMP